jgi:glycosyltransferase involved in cell wall biosynthesis
MEKDKSRILIVIPAYNEAPGIAAVIHKIRLIMPRTDILVVNDGSVDNTANLALEAGAKVVSLPFNMGYGVACQTGFKYAKRHDYDFVLQMDADGQHDPKCIPDLITEIQQGDADVVMGSRWLAIEKYDGPLLRKFGKFYFAFLAGVMTNIKVTDPTTGYQVFNRDVIHFYCTEVYPVDYPDADVIIMLDRAGFHVKEIPVVMYHNHTGKSMHAGLVRPLYYGLKMMLSILMTMMRDDRGLRAVQSKYQSGKLSPTGGIMDQETLAIRSRTPPAS